MAVTDGKLKKLAGKIEKKIDDEKRKAKEIGRAKKTGDRIINGRLYRLDTIFKNKREADKYQLNTKWTFSERCAKGIRVYKMVD
jgi:hypothetical protein